MLAMAACMTDRGWTVTLTPEGMGSNYPAEQADRFQNDEQQCAAQAGIAGPPPKISESEAAWLYDEFVRITPCVEAEGVSVDPPPSKAAFVEQLVAFPIPVWHPFDHAPQRSPELERACPITPWTGR